MREVYECESCTNTFPSYSDKRDHEILIHNDTSTKIAEYTLEELLHNGMILIFVLVNLLLSISFFYSSFHYLTILFILLPVLSLFTWESPSRYETTSTTVQTNIQDYTAQTKNEGV